MRLKNGIICQEKKQNNFVRSLRALGTSWALWNWAFSAPVFPVPSPPSKSGCSLPTAPWLPVIMPCQTELAAQEILLQGPNPCCHLQKCPRAAFLLSTERRWNPRVHLETPAQDIPRDITPLGTFAPCSHSLAVMSFIITTCPQLGFYHLPQGFAHLGWAWAQQGCNTFWCAPKKRATRRACWRAATFSCHEDIHDWFNSVRLSELFYFKLPETKFPRLMHSDF